MITNNFRINLITPNKMQEEQTIQELFNSLSGFNDTAISKDPIKGITRNEFSNEIF
jgi:hypothetical protein